MTAFNDRAIVQALKNTAVLAISTALIAVFLHSLIAYIIVRGKFFAKNALDLLTWLPFAVPGIRDIPRDEGDAVGIGPLRDGPGERIGIAGIAREDRGVAALRLNQVAAPVKGVRFGDFAGRRRAHAVRATRSATTASTTSDHFWPRCWR